MERFATLYYMTWFFSPSITVLGPFYTVRGGRERWEWERRKKHLFPVSTMCLETWRLNWKLNHPSIYNVSYSGCKRFHGRKMATDQAILSLSPTFCHVFIAIIEQNLCHNRLISWMVLPRVGKSLGPYMSVINKVLQPSHGWLLRMDQKQGLFWKHFVSEGTYPRGHWTEQEEVQDERQLLCGVVSPRGLS